MVMRQMRGMAKWIMLVVAVSFVGWMVFQVGMDVTGQGSGGAASDTALRINGVKIDYQSFLAAVRNASERERNQTGSAPITLDDQRRLEDQVVEELITEVILNQEYDRRGIRVSAAEINAAARTSPPPEIMNVPEFQTDGQFDMAKYLRYLDAAADQGFKLSLEARYRTEIPRIKLYEQLTSSIYVPDSRLWRMYQDENDSATVELVAVLSRMAFANEEFQVAERDLRAYYDDHQDEYRRPATAYLSYVATPRTVDVSDSTTALELANELYREITQDGVALEDVARRESADSATRDSGGDLGDTPLGRFHPDFEAAALALNPGDVSEPIQTPFGYHIIELVSRDEDSYHARHVLIRVELRGDHLIAVEDRADTLDLFGAEQEDPEALERVATKLGIAIRQPDPLQQGIRLRIDGERVPDVAIWAFEAREGETSQVLEAPQHYYLFRLDSLDEEEAIPFGEVRDQISEILELDLRAERGMTLAAELRTAMLAGSSAAALAAQTIGISVDTLGPFTRINPGIELGALPEVIGLAFGLELGAVSEPFVADNRNVYLVHPLQRFEADTTAFLQQLEAQRQRVTPIARDARIRMFLAALRDGANVIDRRREIEELQRQLADQQGLIPGIPGGF